MGGIKRKISRLKNIFFNVLSFGTPQAIVFNLLSIIILLAAIPTHYLDKFPGKCIFKTVILPLIFRGNCPKTGLFAGCECPACGLTHAMSRLLHGDLTGAWQYNKMVFIVLPLMVTLIIINIKRLKQHNLKQKRINTSRQTNKR